ncbi:hypothetical protein GH714_024827 [Hevea brasiliensis]|uniref:Cytochrome P450 n=1 Tax=Hevea brasiliensis TaxID=3981 RepID=A0A6A6M8V5_HEVBR|nr:hypothetical protein GH714_024827 [Hevea brasiliensis]
MLKPPTRTSYHTNPRHLLLASQIFQQFLLHRASSSSTACQIWPCSHPSHRFPTCHFHNHHEAAHRALVQSGSVFASRPPALETSRILFSNQHTLTTAPYGSLWRLLRRNFISVTHPSRLHLYSHGRKWALEILKKKLVEEAESSDEKAFPVIGHFQHAMFCLLAYMEDCVQEDVETAFTDSWRSRNVLLPLIKARREKHKNIINKEEPIFSYVDSLLDLRLPDGEREFLDGELVSLCSEFINGGTDTSTTTLQWVMANIVKQENIQNKLLKEINTVTEAGSEIQEKDLKRMPYLKAVVLETLRRHPPGHFILPRAVTEDMKFDGYDIQRMQW